MWWIKNVRNQWKLDKHRITTLLKKKTVSKGLYLTIVSFLSYVFIFDLFLIWKCKKYLHRTTKRISMLIKSYLNYTSPSVTQKIHQADNFVMGKNLKMKWGNGEKIMQKLKTISALIQIVYNHLVLSFNVTGKKGLTFSFLLNWFSF